VILECCFWYPATSLLFLNKRGLLHDDISSDGKKKVVVKSKHFNKSSYSCHTYSYSIQMSAANFNPSSTNATTDNQEHGPIANYTEVGQNGEILYQSDSVPVELSAMYLQPKDTVAQRNAAMTGQKTSDQYRAFDIPARFDNPGIKIFIFSLY
jgi:hypothetical protein